MRPLRESIGQYTWRTVSGPRISGTVVVFCLFLVIVITPWTSLWPKTELDDSWSMVLHWAFLADVDFGRDIVFTYGPWGFLFQGYHPLTYPYTIVAWIIIAVVSGLTLVQIAGQLSGRRWIQGAWVLGMVMLIGDTAHGMQDIWLFTVCWGLVLLHFYVDDRPFKPLKIALAVALGLISLGKFSLAIAAFMAVSVVSLDLARRRTVPWLMAIYLGAVLVLWVAAGQNPVNIVAYLYHAFQITSGYAQGEGKSSLNEARDVLIFLTCAGFFVGVLVSVHRNQFLSVVRGPARERRRQILDAFFPAVLKVASLAAALFLCFKMGYVRHDGHELLATTTMAAFSLMYFAVLWPSVKGKPLRYAVITLPVICITLNWFSYASWGTGSFLGSLAEPIVQLPRRSWMAARTVVGAGTQRADYEKFLESYRQYRDLPPVTGTVDGFSWIQCSILAHSLNYRPRPVFQGYLAYVPELTRLNAQSLQSDRAPDSILFDLHYIDGCYTSQTEASSWPELLGRYDLKDASRGALLLQRAQPPRQAERVSLRETKVRLGEWISVPPAAGPVWVRMKITPTMAGRTMEILYKPPELAIQVKTANGKTTESKLIRGIAHDGFLLSPMITDRMSFAMLWSNRWREELGGGTVTAMQVTQRSTGANFAYEPEFELVFEELRFLTQDVSSIPGIHEYRRFNEFTRNVQAMSDTPVLGMIDDQWKTVLSSPPLTRWALDVPAGATSVYVSFGILKKSYVDIDSSEPVEFRIYAARPIGGGQLEATPFWGRRMAPATVEADRGTQSGEIPLPVPPPPKIILETVSERIDGAIDAYWAGAHFPR